MCCQTQCIKIMGDACVEFKKVINAHKLLQDIEDVKELPRIPIRRIEDINSKIKSSLQTKVSTSDGSVLHRSLVSRISTYEDKFSDYLNEVQEMKAMAWDALQKGCYHDSEVLTALKAMKVITTEEITMDYLSVRNEPVPSYHAFKHDLLTSSISSLLITLI